MADVPQRGVALIRHRMDQLFDDLKGDVPTRQLMPILDKIEELLIEALKYAEKAKAP